MIYEVYDKARLERIRLITADSREQAREQLDYEERGALLREHAPSTNQEMYEWLVERSKTGPLMQVFIRMAMSSYAESVKAAIENDSLETGFIDASAWKRCADEILELEERMSRASEGK